jgi:hypothetical protein
MAALSRDLRFALRMLRKSPGFTTVATLTLALAIGANTAIFSFVDGVLLKPLPYDDPERIVRIMEKPPQGERNGISTLNFLDWQQQNEVFDFHSAQAGGPVTMTGGTEPVQLRGGRVSADYFRIFGIQAALGRTFLSGEDQLGKDDVAVLSRALWKSQFGADPLILNRTLLLDNRPHTVVGVLPEGSAFDRAFNQISDVRTVEQIREQAMGSRRLQSVLLAVFGAVALILAGLGVYGVISYSVVQRTRELGIRAALGASETSLLRLALDRGVLLTVLGLVVGVGGALALTRLMATLLYGVGPRDPATMVSVAVVLGFVAVAASYVPSRRATRVDPIVALRYE